MNFFHQVYPRVIEWFRSQSPGARITAGLSLAVMVVGLACFVKWQSVGTEEYIYGGREFSQDELGVMEAAFAKAGLNKSQIVGNRMRVPRSLKDKYLAALVDGNAGPKSFGDASEFANQSSNPFESNKAREDRQRLVKQRELSLIISKMAGIRTATVQFDEIDRPFPKRKERSALVAVQPAGKGPLDEERVRAIRTLVVGAIAGLEPAKVAITDLGSGQSHPGASPSRQLADDDRYVNYKRVLESDLQKKICDLLSMYPGLVVGVNVELTAESENRSENKSSPISLGATEIEAESQITARGLASNSPAQVTSNLSGVPSANVESRIHLQGTMVQQPSAVPQVGLSPKRVTASIALPASYFTKVWRELHPAPPGTPTKQPDAAELRKIEEYTRAQIETSVARLLPTVEQENNPYPLVTVTTYTDFPHAVEPLPSTADKATAWLTGNWQTLVLVLAGLFGLIMLRGLWRSKPTATSVATAADSMPQQQVTIATREVEPGDGDEVPTRRRRVRPTEASLRDELTDMVKEDPSAAVNVLRNWIGDAA